MSFLHTPSGCRLPSIFFRKHISLGNPPPGRSPSVGLHALRTPAAALSQSRACVSSKPEKRPLQRLHARNAWKIKHVGFWFGKGDLRWFHPPTPHPFWFVFQKHSRACMPPGSYGSNTATPDNHLPLSGLLMLCVGFSTVEAGSVWKQSCQRGAVGPRGTCGSLVPLPSDVALEFRGDKEFSFAHMWVPHPPPRDWGN